MARSAKKSEEFIVMPRTRAMLSDMWEHWRMTLGHTPDRAKKLMTLAIKEMHKAEVATLKKTKPKKTKAKKFMKKTMTKAVPAKARKTVKSKASKLKRSTSI